jgi:dihydrofolate reductase
MTPAESKLRKLKIIEHISLDGVIQHSADEDDFAYGNWTAPYRSPAGRDAILAAHGKRFDLLLGRRTYDIWSGYWPKAPSSPMADGLNAATKYVATHRPESLEWGPFEAFGPDIVEGILRIKSQDGPDLILWGSSTLTSTVLEHGLADEVVLAVYPVLLGTGKRFLQRGRAALVRARRHDRTALRRHPQRLRRRRALEDHVSPARLCSTEKAIHHSALIAFRKTI